MTLTAIATCIAITIIALIFAAVLIYNEVSEAKGIILFVAIIISLLAWGIGIWYCNYTESGKRALKTQQSNFDGGITRHVKVYDVNGELIQEYQGKFDIEYDDDRILFDDENGLRHIIYYPTGTVIIDEMGE